MTTLFIDTHLNDILVFLLKDGKCVDKREVINKKNNSEVLFPTIKELIDGKKIDEIIVVNGPGSFTSVRLGVTIAKTLAYTMDIPIKTITSLEVLAISSEKLKVGISGAQVSTGQDASICIREVNATSGLDNYLQDILGDTVAVGDFKTGKYYQIVVFFQLDIPIVKQVYNFESKAETKI